MFGSRWDHFAWCTARGPRWGDSATVSVGAAGFVLLGVYDFLVFLDTPAFSLLGVYDFLVFSGYTRRLPPPPPTEGGCCRSLYPKLGFAWGFLFLLCKGIGCLRFGYVPGGSGPPGIPWTPVLKSRCPGAPKAGNLLASPEAPPPNQGSPKAKQSKAMHCTSQQSKAKHSAAKQSKVKRSKSNQHTAKHF